MARLRFNDLSATLGASLSSSGTTITFTAPLAYNGGATPLPSISGSDYLPIVIQSAGGSEIAYLGPYTSGATTATLSARGQEGTTGVAHSLGDKVVHGPTAKDVSIGYAASRYNSGTITVSSSSMSVLSNTTSGTIQLTIPAVAGDLLEVCLNAQATDPSTPTQNIDLNVATFVSGVETTRIGGTGSTGSIPAWSIRSISFWPLSGSVMYSVSASDLQVDGTVNLRLMGLVGGGSGSRGLLTTAAAPLDFFVKNLGSPRTS